MSKQLLRVNEAALVLNVSRWAVYRWVEEGRLRGTKIGKGSCESFTSPSRAWFVRIRPTEEVCCRAKCAATHWCPPSFIDVICIDQITLAE
jgi:excisionase family DNA binding protein